MFVFAKHPVLSQPVLYTPLQFKGKSNIPKPIPVGVSVPTTSRLQEQEAHQKLLEWVQTPFEAAVTSVTPELAQWTPIDLLKGLDRLRWGVGMKMGTTIMNLMLIPGLTLFDGVLGISAAEKSDPHQKSPGIWALDHPENRNKCLPYGVLGLSRDLISQTLAVNLSPQAWSRSFIPLVNHGMERGKTKHFIGLFESHRGIDLLVEKGLVAKTTKKIRLGYAKSEPLLTGYKITPLGYQVMKALPEKPDNK
jgi:hypothetical protein